MRATAALVLILVLVLALLLAGCGRPTEPTKQAEALHSIAAEGLLVADGVVEQRTTRPFVRVHGEALAEQARSLEGVAASARLRSLAGRIAAQLERLAAHAGNRGVAEQVATRLEREGRVADRLTR
jgi:hypothetical protein